MPHIVRLLYILRLPHIVRQPYLVRLPHKVVLPHIVLLLCIVRLPHCQTYSVVLVFFTASINLRIWQQQEDIKRRFYKSRVRVGNRLTVRLPHTVSKPIVVHISDIMLLHLIMLTHILRMHHIKWCFLYQFICFFDNYA